MEAEPKTLMEAIRYFTEPEVCLNFVANLRWPNGVACPTCGSKEVTFMAKYSRSGSARLSTPSASSP